MKIKQYNFIRGESMSGRSMTALSMVKYLNNTTIYFDFNFSSSNYNKNQYLNKNMCVISMNRKYSEVLKYLTNINKDCYNRLDIVFDSIDELEDDFTEFIDLLPKNHRYFFITKNRTFKKENNWESSEIVSYHDSYLLPINSISVFDMIKNEDGILLYSLNTKESYYIGDISQAIRNMKINEMLSNDSEN